LKPQIEFFQKQKKCSQKIFGFRVRFSPVGLPV